MIAYNRQSLDNLHLQKEAREAFEKKILTAEEVDRIHAAYPYHFYLPNFFIRIGLFALTVIAAACGLGIFLLMGLDSSSGITATLIIYGIMAYYALELFVCKQKMYGSGVDDALLWIASTLIFEGINFSGSNSLSPTLESALICILALIGMLRYADRVMTLVAYGELLLCVYYLVSAWGPAARAILPFMIMAISIGCYFWFTTLHAKTSLRRYRSNFMLLRGATLVSLYLSGNYFVLHELNTAVAGNPAPVTLGWLWWLFTAAIPVFYIAKGLQKKEVLFLWTGMALVAGSISTFRYYYHVLPGELAMIIAGIVLIAGVYGLTRYLRTPRMGFTAAAPDYPHLLENLPVEGLIIAESFNSIAVQPADTGVHFGGGTTGGGGAGGQY
ncbi:hypothetical protein [Puia sp.]|jgi:hypothetical protein|uniref:hypothetical protein n=1 Tax=Puia sp. TaxID=2045100 RepID=UPI002F410A7F